VGIKQYRHARVSIESSFVQSGLQNLIALGAIMSDSIRLSIGQLGRAVWAHFWHQQEQEVPQPNDERAALLLHALWEWASAQGIDLDHAFEKARILFAHAPEEAVFPTGNAGVAVALSVENKL
jgi:hypothetical protein